MLAFSFSILASDYSLIIFIFELVLKFKLALYTKTTEEIKKVKNYIDCRSSSAYHLKKN